MIINSCPLVGQDSFFSPHSSVCSYLYNELILCPMPQSVLKSKLSECFKNILILFLAVRKEKKPKNWEKRSVVTTPICRQEKTCSEGTSLCLVVQAVFLDVPAKFLDSEELFPTSAHPRGTFLPHFTSSLQNRDFANAIF